METICSGGLFTEVTVKWWFGSQSRWVQKAWSGTCNLRKPDVLYAPGILVQQGEAWSTSVLKILFGKHFAVLLAHTELSEAKLREAQENSVPQISLLLSLIKRAEIGVENIYQSYTSPTRL